MPLSRVVGRTAPAAQERSAVTDQCQRTLSSGLQPVESGHWVTARKPTFGIAPIAAIRLIRIASPRRSLIITKPPVRVGRIRNYVGAGTGVDRGFPFCTVKVTNSLVACDPFFSVCGVSDGVSHENPGLSIIVASPLMYSSPSPSSV